MQNITAALKASSPSLGLLVVAIAPTMVLLSYLYVRDKYEKEPLALLAKAFLFGCLSVLPVIVIELQLTQLNPYQGLAGTAYDAFVVAGLVEELFKLGAVYLAVYGSPHFNEPYDGVIYAASASLGFATIENIGYVLKHGLGTGIHRAILAVPGHALWGIAMGYYLGVAKFAPAHKRKWQWVLALVVPVVLHGSYDLIAYNMNTVLSILMYPLVAFLWVTGLRKIDRASAASPFRIFGALGRGESYVATISVGKAPDALPIDTAWQQGTGEGSQTTVPRPQQGSTGRKISCCPTCRGQVNLGSVACPHCGLPLAFCRVCQTPVPAATNFCGECGAPLR